MKQRQLISFDWALKRLLRSKANFEILEGFLSELLHDEVYILEILESESNKEFRDDKFNRVDLKVKNTRDEIIVIELQYERELDYLHRLLYSTAKAITEHMSEGESYANVVKIISISILYFDLGRGTDYIYLGKTTFRGMHTHEELGLDDGQKAMFQRSTVASIFPEYYLIKVKRFDDVARDTLDEWIYFLKNSAIREEFTARGLKKAKEKLDILQLPEAERKAYERYQDDLRDQASLVQSTYGIGKWEGLQEGMQVGEQKGRQEGEQKGNAEMLLNLLGERFGSVPDWVRSKCAQADLDTLKTWSRKIFRAEKIHDIFQ
ncbi:MAG: Rpn family recombination-promoting nuclease/putative transposase [Magnetococcales bacterium]|nr:Rpn family recombination-promoting nuclease/putative transposase [Magnetococcales bacterium]NGZ28469.1 Rpn family recombination-promoting nuclease/putative transposase [Magnetococcales bacterium]